MMFLEAKDKKINVANFHFHIIVLTLFVQKYENKSLCLTTVIGHIPRTHYTHQGSCLKNFFPIMGTKSCTKCIMNKYK